MDWDAMKEDLFFLCDIPLRDFGKLTLRDYKIYIKAGIRKQNQIQQNNLDLAMYITSLVLNKEAKQTYDKLSKAIHNNIPEPTREPKKVITNEEFMDLMNKHLKKKSSQ